MLKIFAATGLGALAGSSHAPANPPNETTSSAAPIPEVVSEQLILDQDGVQVWADSSNKPTRWQDPVGEGTFDAQHLADASQQALDENDYQLAKITRVRTVSSLEQSAPTEISHNKITTKPEHIVSPEELANRHIEIIDSEKVGFHIRESAFASGGIMEQYTPTNGRRLTIVITDAPKLTTEAFQDGRYDAIRDVTDKAFLPAAAYRQNLSVPETSDPTQQDRVTQVLTQLTDQEFADWGLTGFSGYALNAGHEQGRPDTDFLFLAIGQPDSRPPSVDVIQITADPLPNSFEVQLVAVPLAEVIDASRILSLDPGQSFSPPDTYTDLPDHPVGSMPWKLLAGVVPEAKDPYFVAIHEAEHLKRYSLLDEQEIEPEGVERQKYYSEQEVDRSTKAQIKAAYEQYQQTGDDSKYPFVLENKSDGYFVIG